LSVDELGQVIPFAEEIRVGHVRIGVDSEHSPFMDREVLLNEILLAHVLSSDKRRRE
jgi:hypothetical protein